MISIPAITVFAIVAITMVGLAIYSFRKSTRYDGQPTWWFMMGFGCMALAALGRGAYWDVVWSLLRDNSPETATVWREAVGGTDINILFYVPMIVGAYCILKCRQKLLEEEEQELWPWYKVWMHPRTFSFFRWPWK